MKYKIHSKTAKNTNSRGKAYWEGKDFNEHLKLTYHQTSYLYFTKNYPPPRKVLDAGCGIGRWVIPLAKANYDITGIDIEGEALDTIEKHYSAGNLSLVEGDIFNMDFKDNTFDIILSMGVLEHFENPNLQKNAIMEHIRVLKEEGILLITIPQISFVRFFFHAPYRKLLSLVRVFKGIKHHFVRYYYGQGEFQKIIEKCELKVIDIVYDDLIEPYNFGLTIDYPINRLFREGNIPFKANKLGNKVFKFLWNIHPKLVCGGIGFICQKKHFKKS